MAPRPRWRAGNSARQDWRTSRSSSGSSQKSREAPISGGRLAFSPDGKLFVTLGERFKFAPAQDLSNHLGKIVRINPDGSVPPDNPFVGREDARPEIWSYGHRNPQGAAIHPKTGKLWETEFGPMGGDELNIPEAGRNYGWPVVSWGKHYDGTAIPEPPTHPEFADAITHWTPVISPSGMTFYTGDAIPAWQGNLLIGGLSSEALVRLTLDGEAVKAEERIPMGARIRDVAEAPDGSVYLLTDEDDGKILRLTLKPRTGRSHGWAPGRRFRRAWWSRSRGQKHRRPSSQTLQEFVWR